MHGLSRARCHFISCTQVLFTEDEHLLELHKFRPKKDSKLAANPTYLSNGSLPHLFKLPPDDRHNDDVSLGSTSIGITLLKKKLNSNLAPTV